MRLPFEYDKLLYVKGGCIKRGWQVEGALLWLPEEVQWSVGNARDGAICSLYIFALPLFCLIIISSFHLYQHLDG